MLPCGIYQDDNSNLFFNQSAAPTHVLTLFNFNNNSLMADQEQLMAENNEATIEKIVPQETDATPQLGISESTGRNQSQFTRFNTSKTNHIATPLLGMPNSTQVQQQSTNQIVNNDQQPQSLGSDGNAQQIKEKLQSNVVKQDRDIAQKDNSNYDDADIQYQNHLIFDYDQMNQIAESSSNNDVNSKQNNEGNIINIQSPSQVILPIYGQSKQSNMQQKPDGINSSKSAPKSVQNYRSNYTQGFKSRQAMYQNFGLGMIDQSSPSIKASSTTKWTTNRTYNAIPITNVPPSAMHHGNKYGSTGAGMYSTQGYQGSRPTTSVPKQKNKRQSGAVTPNDNKKRAKHRRLLSAQSQGLTDQSSAPRNSRMVTAQEQNTSQQKDDTGKLRMPTMSHQASVKTQPTMQHLNNSQFTQSSGPIPHDQRLIEYAQNKLNQLLIFDKDHGRFRLMGQMGGVKNLKFAGIKGSRYTVMDHGGKNLQQHMYPKSDGTTRFMPRTHQRNLNLKQRALQKEKQYAEQQQIEEMIQHGEQLPKHRASRQNSKLLLKRSSTNFLRGEGQMVRQHSQQHAPTSVTTINKSNQNSAYKLNQTHGEDRVYRNANLLLNAARYQERNKALLAKTLNSSEQKYRKFSTAKEESGNHDYEKTNYTSLDHRVTPVPQGAKPSIITQNIFSAKGRSIKDQNMLSNDQIKSAGVVIERYKTTNAMDAKMFQVLDEEDLTSIIQIIDDGQGGSVKRDFEEPSRLGSHISLPNQLTINEFSNKNRSSPQNLHKQSQSNEVDSIGGHMDSTTSVQKAMLMEQQKIYLREKSPPHISQKTLSKKEIKHIKNESMKQFENQPRFEGTDPKYFNDEDNFAPNMDYSVSLDFKKEFIRHKRIVCSLKTLQEFDIVNKWDLCYCRTFCHKTDKVDLMSHGHLGVIPAARDPNVMKMFSELNSFQNNPQIQLVGEQEINKLKKHVYAENYSSEKEIQESVRQVIQEMREKQTDQIDKREAYININTGELVEKYRDPKYTNKDGVGINEFMDNIVLRFKSEHEISLYFEIIDQLTQIVILKGRKVLLEKEHYSEIMNRYIEVCKNYMIFLCKDEDYTSFVNHYLKKEEAGGQDNDSNKSEERQTQREYIDSPQQEQKMRFMKKEQEHRSFIRAYLFDYIFKIFIQILDESLWLREGLIKEKKEEWDYFAMKKQNHLENEIAKLCKQINQMKQDHDKECQMYDQRIAQLKEEQSAFQNIINDYKFDLNSLTAVDLREEKVEKLRRHIKETKDFINEAEREMEFQSEIIQPVLAMVNIAATNQKYKELGTQTDCQINSYMAHLNTQVDAESIMAFANTSMSKMQSCIQSLKALEEASGDNMDQPMTPMKRKEKTQRKRSPSKKKSYASRRGGLSSELSKMLEELDSEPMSLDDMVKVQGQNLSDYHKYVSTIQKDEASSMNWTLSDFLCNKYLKERDNMMKAALESNKMMHSLCQAALKEHPFTLTLKKLLGLDGFAEPNVATCVYICSLKESMDKEIQIGQNNNLYFQQMVEYLKKTFKGNDQVFYQLIDILPEYMQKKDMQKIKLNSIEIIVSEEEFQLPKSMSKYDQAQFFKDQVTVEPLYWHKLSFTVIYLLAQLRIARKELRKLLQQSEESQELKQLSLKEFYQMLSLEASVMLSESQLQLLNTFIDPLQQSVNVPKFKFDYTRLVDVLEKQMTSMQLKSVKVMQYQLLNCLFDIVPPLMAKELPFSINGVARSSIPVHSFDIANVANETQSPMRKSEKKRASQQD